MKNRTNGGKNKKPVKNEKIKKKWLKQRKKLKNGLN